MKAIVILGLFLAAVPAVLAAEDPLRAAKDLYASASYEEALTTLAAIEPPAAEIARQVDMYRAFSLYALGRTAEAETVAESLIRREPLVDLDEAAPRIEAMFQNVRKRLLPVLIRAEYRTARTDLDEKRPESAKAHLIGARQLLARAQTIGAWDEGLADLQVLVDGFLDLTRAAADQPLPSAPAVNAAASETARQIDALLPTQRAAAPTIYGPEDEGVTPPSTVEQRVPRLPEQLRRLLRGRSGTGVFDLVIDETGAVQQATVRTSIHAVYDELVVVSSRSWRYVPATRNGVPVRYRKSIQVTLNQE
jgi:Gram-negative bacterial TonB protein C-terminal